MQTSVPYSEKLQNPRWQKKRLEILNRDGFKCQLCEDETSTLHVHHKMYIKGREPWDYENDNFITYCFICHKAVELLKSKNYEVIEMSNRLSEGNHLINAFSVKDDEYYFSQLIYNSSSKSLGMHLHVNEGEMRIVVGQFDRLRKCDHEAKTP